MEKKLRIVALTLAGLLIFYLYVNAYYRYEFIRKYSPHSLRRFAQWFIPSTSFYIILANEELRLDEVGYVKEFKYKNPYIGFYAVEILFDHYSDELHYDPATKNRYMFKGEIGIEFYVNSKLMIKEVIKPGRLNNSFWFGKGGFTLFGYKVSEDLPPDAEITCRVYVVKPDIYLNNKYGPVRLTINKISDL